MTTKALKLTLFVIVGISILYWLKEPFVVTYVQHGVIIWNWSVDRILNFRIYHPLAFALLPIAILVLLASR